MYPLMIQALFLYGLASATAFAFVGSSLNAFAVCIEEGDSGKVDKTWVKPLRKVATNAYRLSYLSAAVLLVSAGFYARTALN